MNTIKEYIYRFIYLFKKKHIKMNKKSDLKIGDPIKVTGNRNGSNYTVGGKYEITLINHDDTVQAKDGNWFGNNLNLIDFIVLGRNLEFFEKKKEKLAGEITQIQSTIDWMTENDIEEYDDDEFKAWQTLTLLEDDTLSKSEKAKLIADLLKR